MRQLNEATNDNFERALKVALANVKKSGQTPIYVVSLAKPAAKPIERVYAKGTPSPSQLDAKIVPALMNIILGEFRKNLNHHKIKQGLGPYKNVWTDYMLTDFHIMYNICDDPAMVTILYIGDHANNPAYRF